jgi:hypothetical protein
VEGLRVPVGLESELRGRARAFTSDNGSLRLLFATRGDANEAVDLLRSNGCEIESLGRTRSTLEEVFMKTVEGGEAQKQ